MTANRIELRHFQEENQDEWSEFVKTCDEAWVFHTPSFVMSFPYDFSFSIRIDGSIQGVCVIGRVACRVGAYFVGPGTALSEIASNKTVYTVLRAKLKALAALAGCQRVEFILPPMAPANTNKKFEDSILYFCDFSEGGRWRKSWERLPGFFSVIDLGLDIDDIIRGFSKGNRASVARCNKLGLKFAIQTRQGACRQSWEEFVRIHRLTYTRTKGESFSNERLEYLFQLVESGHLTLLSCIEGEICVSCLLLATDKKRAFYLAGGASDNARQKGVMAWAHSQAIRWLKANGYIYYCLGFTIIALEGTAIGAIGDSKKRFGGDRWPMLCGDLILNPFSFLARQVAPELVNSSISKVKNNLARYFRAKSS